MARDDDLAPIAHTWWLTKRPVGWTEWQHLGNPWVNCGDDEAELAEAVAVWVAERSHVRTLPMGSVRTMRQPTRS